MLFILRWLFGRTFGRFLKEAVKKEDDFDEYVEAHKSMDNHMSEMERLAAKLEKQQKSLNEHNRKKK